VPTLETPMSPGGSQASAGEGLSPCNIGIGIGIFKGSVYQVSVAVSASVERDSLSGQ